MDFPSFGAGAMTSIVSAGINDLMGQITSERNEARTKRQLQFEDTLTRDLTHDTPLLQLSGMKAAGVSPSILSGFNPQAQTSSSSAVPQQEQPKVSAADVAGIVSADAQAKLADAQARNLDADTKLKETESDYKPLFLKASLDYQHLVNDQEQIKKDIASRTKDSVIQKAVDEARLVGDQADLVEIDVALRKIDQQYYDKQKANELLIQLQTLENLRKDGKIKDKQVGLLAAQTLAAYASANESYSSAVYNKALTNQVNELTPFIRKKYNNEAAVAFQQYGKIQAEKGLINWENKVKSHLDPETESYMRRWSQVLGGGAEATGMVRDGAITYGLTGSKSPKPVKGFNVGKK